MNKVIKSLVVLGLSPVLYLSSTPGFGMELFGYELWAPGELDPLCSQYPTNSRQAVICNSYSERERDARETLPESSNDLMEGVLYIISKVGNKIQTPYDIPEGSSVINDPSVEELNLVLTGKGSDDKCGLCAIRYTNGTRIAGVNLDPTDPTWKPTPGKTGVKALVYGMPSADGSPTTSEFSDATLFIDSRFDDMIYQHAIVAKPDKNAASQYQFHNLRLFKKGNAGGIRVENSSGKAVPVTSSASWHVEVSGTVINLSSDPVSSPGSEKIGTAISLKNVIARLADTDVIFPPVKGKTAFKRVAVEAIDTPKLDWNLISFSENNLGFREGSDFYAKFENSLHKRLDVYVDNIRYLHEDMKEPGRSARFDLSAMKDPRLVRFITGDNVGMYHSIAVTTDADGIDRVTHSGGGYLGSALELNATCEAFKQGGFNSSDPFPYIASLGKIRGPINATILSKQDVIASCDADGNDCPWLTWRSGAFAGGTGVFGLLLGVAIGSGPHLCRKLVVHRKGYRLIPDEPPRAITTIQGYEQN